MLGNIYFVVNIASKAVGFTIGTGNAGAPATESDFFALSKSYTLETDLLKGLDDVAGIPMVGTLLNQNITSTATLSTFSVKLKRLLARVDFTYSSIVPNFTFTSLRVRNVPAAMGYYPTAAGTIYPASVAANFKDLPYEGSVTLPQTKTYYLPVNMQGSNANTDPTNKAGVGFPCATYFELLGGAATNIRYYSYYIGSGAGDYNVEADKYYKINAIIKGTSLTDKRVTDAVQPESNCYIVKPSFTSSTTIYIPVSRAEAGNKALTDASLTGTGFIVSSDFTAGLLWSDVNSTHVSAEAVLPARCVKVVVPVNAPAGNSIVYALSGGNIVWSWHIWVTDYAPSTTANTGTNSTTYSFYKDLWMDRNLGATTSGTASGTASVSTFGFHYQWGRKDPFPSSSSIKPGVEVSVYQQYPTVKQAPLSPTILPTTAVGSNNLVASINNPSVFYRGTDTNSNDWYSSIANTHIDNLWYNGINSLKTIYDPCPVGWRVPFGTINVTPWVSPWNGLVKPATTWNFGYTWEHGGYYPAAGYRSYGAGALYDVGVNGHYWSASSNSPSAYYLKFYDGGVFLGSYGYGRAGGFSVRCVQES